MVKIYLDGSELNLDGELHLKTRADEIKSEYDLAYTVDLSNIKSIWIKEFDKWVKSAPSWVQARK